jgi:hypothetical protein
MIRFIEEHWPLVVAIAHDELTDEDIEEMKVVYKRIHQRKERFFLVQETRSVKLPTALMRKKLAGLNTFFSEEIERNVIAVGVIVKSKIAVGMLNAIFWVSREKTRTFSTTTGRELFRRATDLCAKEDILLPLGAKTFFSNLDMDVFVPVNGLQET